MGEIEVRLKEGYVNEFLTTVTGYIIRHETWTKVNDNDTEIRQLLNQGRILEVKGADTLRTKIIMDKPSDTTLKGTITTQSLAHNESTINKTKGENKMTEENPNPAPEEQPVEEPKEEPAPEPQPEAAPEEPKPEETGNPEPAPETPPQPEPNPEPEEEKKEEPANDNPEPSPSQN